jgi:hypothetical protein
MPKKLHNIYRIAIFLLGVLPCVISALLWIPALLGMLILLMQKLFGGILAAQELTGLTLFFTFTPVLGLIGTNIIVRIFLYVKNGKEIPLKRIYQGLAIAPLVVVIAFSVHMWGIFLFFPIISLFVAMLYNRSWEKHHDGISDAH